MAIQRNEFLATTARDIGAALKHSRTAAGATQMVAAEAMGIGQPYLSSLEGGRFGSSLTHALRLLRFTGCEIIVRPREPVANPVVIQVYPLSEVRQRLSGILARFRREGLAAAPVAFGPHRKPEAVILPYEVYERYEAIARQRARLDSALSAAQSVHVELPGPFTPDHDREVSAYVDGEISAAEMYRGRPRACGAGGG
jgi:hypothetical protein